MTEHRQKWLKAMMAKYQTDEAGVSQIMRERQKKSMLNPNRQKGKHRGGFSNIELAKQAGDKGRQTQREIRVNKVQDAL